mgnify:CR=1 FL=1
MIFKKMNSRCRIDLTDMQSQPEHDYKFILVYQLLSLKSKRAEEIAHNLLDIFTILGAPSILQSDNGREFCNHIIQEVCAMWSELKIVHGKPRHSQSQGSVERANQDIENMLTTWIETNQTLHWSEGLRFVQFMKNRAHHEDINCSPYEALFGIPAKVGLSTDAIGNLESEEDLEALIDSLSGVLVGDQDGQIENSDEEDGEIMENGEEEDVYK